MRRITDEDRKKLALEACEINPNLDFDRILEYVKELTTKEFLSLKINLASKKGKLNDA